MSFPLTDLAARLAPPGACLGRVVALEGGRVVAATPAGRRVALPASPLRVGDRVVIREGLAYLSPAVRDAVAV